MCWRCKVPELVVQAPGALTSFGRVAMAGPPMFCSCLLWPFVLTCETCAYHQYEIRIQLDRTASTFWDSLVLTCLASLCPAFNPSWRVWVGSHPIGINFGWTRAVHILHLWNTSSRYRVTWHIPIGSRVGVPYWRCCWERFFFWQRNTSLFNCWTHAESDESACALGDACHAHILSRLLFPWQLHRWENSGPWGSASSLHPLFSRTRAFPSVVLVLDSMLQGSLSTPNSKHFWCTI